MIQPVEGGCLCRAVRYRVTGASVARTLCHCRTCRLASGAPSVAWTVFSSSDFSWIGQPPSSFNSSPQVVRTFCGRCGTPLTYQRTDETETMDVTTVSLDSPENFAPTKEIWVEEKLAWERLNDATEHFPQSSVARTAT